jgi:endonuclease III
MKLAFNLDIMLTRIEKAIISYPKAAMFELYEQGYTSLFEQLVSCIISIRTLDEVTIPLSRKLFKVARTPHQFLQLSPEELESLLDGCNYPGQKAYTILGIAHAVIEQYNGELPAEYENLIQLKGVGPKCANLALGVAAQKAGISVDVHVHRVVNRWGIVKTAEPEQTMYALEKIIPQNNWININRLLMPFGKYLCTAQLPKCSTCVVLEFCRQIGVNKHQ